MFAVMALWEVLSPCRTASDRSTRWPSNLGLMVTGAVSVRLLFPVLATGLAAIGVRQGWGILNLFELAPWVAFLLAVLILDFAIYLQHVMLHYLPWLWRLHAVHHADVAFDVTTGVRFHPFEIMLSMLIKLGVVVVVGPPVVAVLVFEIVLNATALFNHSNVRLPAQLDRWLRWLIVTPDMHRVHHSAIPRETNSNYGFNLPWWDRLFGTYRAQPEAGHQAMTIGLEDFREPRELRLDRLLIQPFLRRASRDS
jgi:sterol desaturase/sphingolipid hydroxylase (fatty acid hydroxylase superfamily)